MRTALFVVALAACTHHRDITEAHEASGDVEVSGMYGQAVKAEVVSSPGGVTFIDKTSGGIVPPDEIYKIEDTSHLMGAVQGLGIGFGIGLVGGALIGFSGGDDECEEDSHNGCFLSFSAEGKAMLLGVVLGVLGGGGGLIIGGLSGSTTVYERRTAQSRVVPIGPSGSQAGFTVKF